jgi:hypothetical protein
MKKIVLISAFAVSVSVATAQTFVAGLNFNTITDVSGDIDFDTGDSDGWTLNLDSNGSDDNYSVNGFDAVGWAALGETYTDGTDSYFSGSFDQIPVTVAGLTGFESSTDEFGGTSATSEGFDDTFGITFGDVQGNYDISSGVFTITVGASLTDAYINFDVAALVSQYQTAGTLSVNGTDVTVTSAATNETVYLGDLSTGDLITFDMSGLSNGAAFDNFMVAGTVVPEPSSFAVIAGAIALGFSATRRRRRA